MMLMTVVNAMLSEAEFDLKDHFNPSVRIVEVERTDATTFGFHLTRGKWDPYPWVSKIDSGSAADEAGIRAGDCLLEVNGEDVVGKRISEIAQLVKCQQQAALLLWNAGSDAKCSPETLCCGPMPNNFQRLSACMSSILNHLECPVCLDTTQPPVYQCDNGHIICIRCRVKSEKCPVCRVRYGRGRSLIADNVYHAIMDAFDLSNVTQEIRTMRVNDIFKPKDQDTNANNTLSNRAALPDIKVTHAHANKFLARLIGKASSVENLSSKPSSHSRSNQLTVDAEFNTTSLKTKSLSSSEIFNSRSPGISRTSSINAINCTRCSSTDSLIGDRDQTGIDDGVLYLCPFSDECAILFKGSQVYQHFQSAHDGPLVQYFKHKLSIKLKGNNVDDETTYLIYVEEKYFVLKIIKENNLSCTSHKDLRIWVWLLGNKKQASEYQLQVNLLTKMSDTAILSTRSPIYSLNSVSWVDIKDSKKAVFMNATTLDAINATDLFVEVEIFKSEINSV